MPELKDATVTIGVPGINGGGVTSGELTTAIAGLAPSTATYITQTSNGTLSAEQALDALSGPGIAKVNADGSISLAIGSDLPSHSHTGVRFTLPFVLDGGGVAITTGLKVAPGVLMPAACTYVGWVVDNLTASDIVVTVQRKVVSTGLWEDISGTEKPTTAGVSSNNDLTLTTSLTSISQYDRIRLSVDSATSAYSVVNLLFTRSVG